MDGRPSGAYAATGPELRLDTAADLAAEVQVGGNELRGDGCDLGGV